ncbi:MAG: BA14K family protein [Pseudomonadota bacterium]
MSFSKKSTAVALASAMTLTSLGATTQAHSHDIGWNHFHRHQHVKNKIHRHAHRNVIVQHHTHHHGTVDNGNVGGVLLGILGAAIVVDALSKTHTAPAPTYTPPTYQPHAAPFPKAPNDPLVVYHTQSLEPWTPGWLAWCEERYRSFNKHTGTYRGYDGLDHFCVPK